MPHLAGAWSNNKSGRTISSDNSQANDQGQSVKRKKEEVGANLFGMWSLYSPELRQAQVDRILFP
jgi:hypothetical protein